MFFWTVLPECRNPFERAIIRLQAAVISAYQFCRCCSIFRARRSSRVKETHAVFGKSSRYRILVGTAYEGWILDIVVWISSVLAIAGVTNPQSSLLIRRAMADRTPGKVFGILVGYYKTAAKDTSKTLTSMARATPSSSTRNPCPYNEY